MTENDPTNVPPADSTPVEPVAETQPEGGPAPEPAPVEAATPAPAERPKRSQVPPDGNWWWGTGRRKTAVARVRLRPGDGKFIVNQKPLDAYFTEDRDRNDLMAVLRKTKTNGAVDVHVNVGGGGYTGQAGAILLGLGRALKLYDTSLEPILRDNGFLTRDPRKVERKKYGQPGARKRFQFSKR
ncbi:MAG: 30S ribosomal protein S9 [Planctomycetota bacterium]|jgi:small subunit ribosomal protein S9